MSTREEESAHSDGLAASDLSLVGDGSSHARRQSGSTSPARWSAPCGDLAISCSKR